MRRGAWARKAGCMAPYRRRSAVGGEKSSAVTSVAKRVDGPLLGLETPQRERASRVSEIICYATVRRLVSICTLRPRGSRVSVFRVFTA